VSRYWNGHQWKDLRTETMAARSPAAADEPVTRSTSETAAAVATSDATAVPTRAGLVPTHADYGDVFVAAVAEAAQ
jgi:hypothetical protein